MLEAVINVMRFWLRMGVDGLRLDAIPYLIERDGTNCENLPETHDVLKKLRAALDAEFPNRIFLAEANQWPSDVRPYFGDGDECHMAFHFPVMPRMYMALRKEDRTPIVDIMRQTPEIPTDCQWAIFLRNHDELTLEMVTDEERDYMYREYARDPRMRINVGIRRRLAPLMESGRRQIELMNALLMSMPGTPIIYYGDEIGMGDNVYLGDRNGVRTPMQWSADRNAGFSEADTAALYSPLIVDPPYGYHTVNVAAQERMPTSLLRWMRRIVRCASSIRRSAAARESARRREPLACSSFLRRYEDETILCVNNLSRFAQYASSISSASSAWCRSSCRQHPLSAHRRASVPVHARTAQLLLVQAHVRRRSARAARGGKTLTLTVAGVLENALEPRVLRSIDSATLGAFLRERRWFGEKSHAFVRARASST